MTFALYAMRAMLRGRWMRTGWLFGFAVLLQPLIALTIPLFLAATPAGQRIRFACRCALLSVVTTGVAHSGNPSETYRSLVTQPGEPSLNHPGRRGSPSRPASLRHHLRPTTWSRRHWASTWGVFTAVDWSSNPGIVVSNGPGRLIDVVLALVVAVYVWRRPQPL